MLRTPPRSTSTVKAASAPRAVRAYRGSPVSSAAWAMSSATRAWAMPELPGRISAGSPGTS